MGTAKEKFTEKQQKKAVKHSGPRRKPTTEEGRGQAVDYLPTA